MLLRFIFKLNYEIMYFVIYLFCIVFYIACFLSNKGAVPISFLSSHQRSRILSRSRTSCSRPFRSYILTIRTGELYLKIISSTNVTIGARNSIIRTGEASQKDNNICSRRHNIISGGDSTGIIEARSFYERFSMRFPVFIPIRQQTWSSRGLLVSVG